MLKRTLFFSTPYFLSLKYNQLVAQCKQDGKTKTVPVEDIGFVIIDNMQISITMPLIEALNENNCAVIFCNSKHNPAGMILNLDSHSTQTEIFRNQVDASIPLKKALWKQTVEAKIRNQAKLLELQGKEHNDVLQLANYVKSGDSDNREGTAARLYWQRLFEDYDGDFFLRDRDGSPPNNLLNYGYIILRSAVARAIVGSGMMPALGIHHKNKYNAYCLADDIMEPYRPFIDKRVCKIIKKGDNIDELTTEYKLELVAALADDVYMQNETHPLMVALTLTTASLARAFAGEVKTVKYPELK